ncbi:MAG TPA: MXAN_5187 C-terminal domain-containing protein, partial [Polyangiales bacterium]|nr:MXAN_5187 C-terminal domain-containing protein [Polyangiales bacterium]
DFDLDQVASALEGPPAAESQAPGKITDQMVAHVRATGRVSVPNVGALGPVEARGPAAREQNLVAPEPAGPRTVGRFARPNANAGAAAPAVGSTRASQRPPALAPANDVTPPAKPPALPPQARGTGTVPMPPPPSVGRGTGTVPMPPPPSGRGTGTVPLPPPPSAGRGTGTVPMPPPPSSKAPAKPPLPAASVPRPAPPVVRPPQLSGTVARVDGLDEQRMRRIYEEYAAAKRKNNEPEVRFETLAGSISKMMPDLSKKHAGKQIDFEVVVKDGRVGLKPRAT